ncbi:MAG: hypothetical protein VB980_01005 [Opitutales bacterium]|jgi:hypothetical protein
MACLQIASWVIILSIMLVSCGDRPDDPRSTYRPKFFRENTSIPFLDEHNLVSVQLVEVDNPFPEATRKRMYSLWFYLDGRGRFALHAETGDHLGKTIHMFISGQSIGYHPIQRPLDNGILPILLPPQMQEEDARFLQEQLQRTIAKVQKKKGQ